jgi:hypothetical protein
MKVETKLSTGPVEKINRFYQYIPLVLLILVNLIIGFFTVQSYGQSWDEPGNYRYGIHSLENYYNLFHGLPVTNFNEFFLDQKGPVFFMLGELFSRLATKLIHSWSAIDGWHFSYFLVFETSIISIFFLARRWMSNWTAFGVAILFSTQPLFWGHAFINPKDIPFLAFFLASVTIGFWLVDWLMRPGKLAGTVYAPFESRQFTTDWNEASILRKISAPLILTLWLGLAILTWFSQKVINAGVATVINAAYTADRQSLWGKIFTILAPHANNMAVEGYINKAQNLLPRWELALFVIITVILLLICLRLLSTSAYRWMTGNILKLGIKDIFFYLKSPAIIISAIVLGLTTSIRLTGPYVGVLVAIYAIYKIGKRAIPPTFAYAGCAMLVVYLTWPYLWRDPIGRFIDSMGVMSNYADHIIDAPRFLLLKLVAIQITEPVLILFLAGFVLAIFNFKKEKYLEPFLLTIFWFILPISLMIASNSLLYDNFRQLFFLLPPVFIMAGIALESLFALFRKTWLNVLVIIILVIPGITAIATLHPYEYIYYNSLVGGVKGAFRKYELDYWATSYKEATQFLNETAPQNARIGVIGPDLLVSNFTRSDLKVIPFDGINQRKVFDYVVVSSRANNDLAVCPNAPIIKTIEREEAILTVVRKLSPAIDGCR